MQDSFEPKPTRSRANKHNDNPDAAQHPQAPQHPYSPHGQPGSAPGQPGVHMHGQPGTNMHGQPGTNMHGQPGAHMHGQPGQAPYPYQGQNQYQMPPRRLTREELRERLPEETKQKLKKRSILSLAIGCTALLVFFMFVAFSTSAENTRVFGVAVTLHALALVMGFGAFSLGLTALLTGVMSDRFIPGLSVTGIVLGAVAIFCGFIAVIVSIVGLSSVASYGVGGYYTVFRMLA